MPWSTSRRRASLPQGWSSRIRPAILQRDGHRCTRRLTDGSRCTETTRLEVHHIGDRDDHQPENLTTLCHWHHGRETAQESGAARRAQSQARRARPAEAHPGLR